MKIKLADTYFDDGSKTLYGSSLYIISEDLYELDPSNMREPEPGVCTIEKIEKVETYVVVKPLENDLEDMLYKTDSNVNGNSVNLYRETEMGKKKPDVYAKNRDSYK
ncbi:unnamed protein product [Rhizophagus irregularis]|nr:unnamed protein product [Rhizophagus irregularis]